MKKVNLSTHLTPYIILYSAFIVCAIVGMLIYPDTFYKFFSPTELSRTIPSQLPQKSYYWDIEHYANMALQNTCTAFYPFWGFIITHLFYPQSLEQYANYFKITATAIFCISTPLVFWIFKKAFKKSVFGIINYSCLHPQPYGDFSRYRLHRKLVFSTRNFFDMVAFT